MVVAVCTAVIAGQILFFNVPMDPAAGKLGAFEMVLAAANAGTAQAAPMTLMPSLVLAFVGAATAQAVLFAWFVARGPSCLCFR